jgi:hypothetical protein
MLSEQRPLSERQAQGFYIVLTFVGASWGTPFLSGARAADCFQDVRGCSNSLQPFRGLIDPYPMTPSRSTNLLPGFTAYAIDSVAGGQSAPATLR